MALGIKLIDNFKTPYLSKNISEFWHRWHISLSTWFRDYLYIPLGGNRVRILRWVLNIMLVFVISGFWHGANWTFIIWGAIHGLLFLAERAGEKVVSIKDSQKPLVNALRVLKTFVLVLIAWVFFRSESAEIGLQILGNVFGSGGEQNISIEPIVLFLFALFIISDVLLYNKRFDRWIDKRHVLVRWTIYSVMLFCIVAFAGHFNHPFIYFQF